MRWAMVSGTVGGEPAIAVDAAAAETGTTARRSSFRRETDAAISSRLCASSAALDSLAYRSAFRIRSQAPSRLLNFYGELPVREQVDAGTVEPTQRRG
jgi:hypothetical protein